MHICTYIHASIHNYMYTCIHVCVRAHGYTYVRIKFVHALDMQLVYF